MQHISSDGSPYSGKQTLGSSIVGRTTHQRHFAKNRRSARKSALSINRLPADEQFVGSTRAPWPLQLGLPMVSSTSKDENPLTMTPATQTLEETRLAELRAYDILDTAPDVLFDQLTALAALMCDAPIALISLVDRDRQWFKSRYGLANTGSPREHAFCAHTIQSADPLIVEDATCDPRFLSNPLVLGEPKIRFYAGVPLTTPSGFALGSLCVIDRRPRTLTDAQLSALKLLAAQVLQQFEFRRAAETIRRQLNLLAKTQETAHIGGWELDLITQKLSWSEETFRIHGLSPKDYVPDVSSAIGLYAATSAPVIRGAVEAAIATGQPYDLELQIVHSDGGTRWVRAIGYREDVAGMGRRLCGVFQDINERRRLEQEIVEIAQREQTRVGYDLHDGLAQELTGIAYYLHSLTNKLPEPAIPLRTQFEELERILAKSIETCRVLARGISPASRDRGGLIRAVKSYAEQSGRIYGIEIGVTSPSDDVALNDTQSDHVFRIIQEAVSNALKHAGCSKVDICFCNAPSGVEVIVADDGVGIQAHANGDGLGIGIMRYRARLMRASVEISPRLLRGTQLRFRIPVDTSSAGSVGSA